MRILIALRTRAMSAPAQTVPYLSTRQHTDSPKPTVAARPLRMVALDFSGRSLPGAVDYFGVAGLAIDQQDLELLVIALREKDVAAHRKVVAHFGRR